ncbi:MAG: molybdate ABC transporter substrate-binding protein [Myxococcota bacterium]
MPTVWQRRGHLWGGLLVAGAVIGLAGCRCGAAREDGVLQVWAAASLVDVLPEVADAWGTRGEPPVRFAFGATSRIARQVARGAPADLVLTADRRWMDHLEGAGALRSGTRTELLRGELVVVVPAGRAGHWRSLEELARDPPDRLALGGEAVPVGRYAEAALRKAAVWTDLEAHVIRADHARAVLAWVGRAEAEAGIVYRTDAMVEHRADIAFAVEPALHPPIVYAAAVPRQARHPAAARRLLTFMASPGARRVFERAGFRAEVP